MRREVVALSCDGCGYTPQTVYESVQQAEVAMNARGWTSAPAEDGHGDDDYCGRCTTLRRMAHPELMALTARAR